MRRLGSSWAFAVGVRSGPTRVSGPRTVGTMSDLPFGFGPSDSDDESRRSGSGGSGGSGPGGPGGPMGFGLPGMGAPAAPVAPAASTWASSGRCSRSSGRC